MELAGTQTFPKFHCISCRTADCSGIFLCLLHLCLPTVIQSPCNKELGWGYPLEEETHTGGNMYVASSVNFLEIPAAMSPSCIRPSVFLSGISILRLGTRVGFIELSWFLKSHPYCMPASLFPFRRSHWFCYLVHLNYDSKNPCSTHSLHFMPITLLRRKGTDKRKFMMLKLHVLDL